MMVKGSCSSFAPAIIDTDGALRWVGTAGISGGSATFFDNAVYLGHGHQLTRIDLDGTVTAVGDYSSLGIVNFHHNIDPWQSWNYPGCEYHNILQLRSHRSGRFRKGFEAMEHGSNYQRSHDRRRRRSQSVRLSYADRLVSYQRCHVQPGGRLSDRFKPGKFPHLSRL